MYLTLSLPAQKLGSCKSARRKVILQVGSGVFLYFWERVASLRHRLDASACVSASHMPGYNLRQESISITNPIFSHGFISPLFGFTLEWTFPEYIHRQGETIFLVQCLNPARALLVVRW